MKTVAPDRKVDDLWILARLIFGFDRKAQALKPAGVVVRKLQYLTKYLDQTNGPRVNPKKPKFMGLSVIEDPAVRRNCAAIVSESGEILYCVEFSD